MGSAYDEEFKSPGLVVLKGRQGLGKTSIFSNLIPIKRKLGIFIRAKIYRWR